MSLEVKVPEMGESIIEATVGKWLKQVGEPVSADEPLVELETDKVNVEVVSSQAGVLEEIIKQEGATVTVSDVLATVAEGRVLRGGTGRDSPSGGHSRQWSGGTGSWSRRLSSSSGG